MKIVRTAYVRVKDIYELDLDEQLCEEVKEHLKRIAVDPDEVPDISVQTLAQCWEDDGSRALLDYTIKIKGYRGEPYEEHLTELVHEYLNDALWECDPYTSDSDTDDWDDEIEYEGQSYRKVIDAPNPDFLDNGDDDSDDDISPESVNDNK